ncbi:MAG: hypothetical protein IMZ64_04675, partial [Bacteroidetes bacterium]|nr:hypothetical protein [Bacteroidota bacterium]
MANYYIAPTGDDSTGNGSIGNPWFTLNEAWSNISAGDIVYLRGGTYDYVDQQSLFDLSGTSGSHISIFNYPTESPILDFSGHADTGMKSGIRLDNVNYVDFKGFRVTDVYQPNTLLGTRNGIYGILFRADVSNCTFEQIEVDHIGGWGFSFFDRISDIYFLNCDSHHHSDPYTDQGEEGDGANYGGSDGWQCGTETVTDITF